MLTVSNYTCEYQQPLSHNCERTMIHKQRNPLERRCLARQMRGLVRLGDSVAVTADHFDIPRTEYYRYVNELVSWEAQATRHEEKTEIEANFKADIAINHSYVWVLASSQWVLDHARGEDNYDIGQPQVVIKEDPLLG